ncbi:MAG: hypothetical protein Alis3KO_28660 [Aliiglaciecola sp.]
MSEPKLELVNFDAHKKIKISNTNFDIAENHVNAVTVVANELSTLIHEYPIFITKHAKTGHYQLMAILGFESGQNLYLDGQSWRGSFIPMDILRRPFHAYIPDQKNPSQGQIAIDLAHSWVNEAQGQSLSDEQGKATDYFKRIENIFSQLMGGNSYTVNALQVAEEHDLIESITLSVDLPNGAKKTLNGLYSFNQGKLTALTGEALEQCHKSGLLQICHLMLSSGANIQKLVSWSV